MQTVAADARTYPGSYQEGWAPLKEATLEDKARKGYGVPDPLLRQGVMRDSIKGEAEETTYGAEGVVASDDPVALYQEMGTSSIPPRPFLGLAMRHVDAPASAVFGAIAVQALTPIG